MIVRPLTVRVLVVLGVLAASGWGTHGVSGRTAGDKDHGGIDAQTVAAWKKAGADVGWVYRLNNSWYTMEFAAQRPADVAAVPGFRLVTWPAGGVQGLPEPSTLR